MPDFLKLLLSGEVGMDHVCVHPKSMKNYSRNAVFVTKYFNSLNDI